jgi:multimeric flavodoxin WrbA
MYIGLPNAENMWSGIHFVICSFVTSCLRGQTAQPRRFLVPTGKTRRVAPVAQQEIEPFFKPYADPEYWPRKEQAMKVVGINGSAQKDGNTAVLINHVLRELENEGIETELIQLSGKQIRGCIVCLKCFQNRDQRCSVTNDALNECLEKMLAADGMILGSPVYFSNVSTEMKALIDRAGFVAKANGDMFQRKVGAAVVAVRRAGSIPTFDAINHFFLISQMIVPGSTYWNMGIGLQKGDVEKDEEGIGIMKTLGQNMAWLLKKVNG